MEVMQPCSESLQTEILQKIRFSLAWSIITTEKVRHPLNKVYPCGTGQRRGNIHKFSRGEFNLDPLFILRQRCLTVAKSVLSKISSYQNIIWDWNGTLLNDSSIGGDAEAELFRRHGLRVQTKEERLRNFFMPVEKYYEKMGFDFAKVPFQKLAEEWFSIYEILVRHAPLFEGVSEMLDGLHREGKKQFVLSAAPESHLHEIVAKHEIDHYFEAIYGLPDAMAASKVKRGIELVDEYRIDPTTAILIGDTSHDYEVGREIGVDVLLIGDGHHAVEVLQSVHHNVLPSRYS